MQGPADDKDFILFLSAGVTDSSQMGGVRPLPATDAQAAEGPVFRIYR